METMWKKVGCSGMCYEEIPQGYKDVFIFVPAMKEIIQISEGTGDNLRPEDMVQGHIDYIYYIQYEVEFGFPEVDGGQIMLDKSFVDKYKCTSDCIPAVLDMAFGDDSMEYIILS